MVELHLVASRSTVYPTCFSTSLSLSASFLCLLLELPHTWHIDSLLILSWIFLCYNSPLSIASSSLLGVPLLHWPTIALLPRSVGDFINALIGFSVHQVGLFFVALELHLTFFQAFGCWVLMASSLSLHLPSPSSCLGRCPPCLSFCQLLALSLLLLAFLLLLSIDYCFPPISSSVDIPLHVVGGRTLPGSLSSDVDVDAPLVYRCPSVVIQLSLINDMMPRPGWAAVNWPRLNSPRILMCQLVQIPQHHNLSVPWDMIIPYEGEMSPPWSATGIQPTKVIAGNAPCTHAYAKKIFVACLGSDSPKDRSAWSPLRTATVEFFALIYCYLFRVAHPRDLAKEPLNRSMKASLGSDQQFYHISFILGIYSSPYQRPTVITFFTVTAFVASSLLSHTMVFMPLDSSVTCSQRSLRSLEEKSGYSTNALTSSYDLFWHIRFSVPT
eukprot:Gb_17027 [translate_table: standard]